MRKAGAVLTIVVGLLLVASSVAHSTLGLPPLRTSLVNAAVDAQVVEAVSVGWYFGSAAMLAFGVIVLADGVSRLSRKALPRLPIRVVASTYVLFGVTAYVLCDLNPHYLGFIVLGVLAGVGSMAPSASGQGTPSE